MNDELRRWLTDREPPPAFDLSPWLEGADSASSGAAALGTLGERALELALSTPGRVRQSALHLLAADALITYACEAALEEEDSQRVLIALLDGVSER